MQPDPDGYRVVYILDSDGIQGAQVRAPEGKTGVVSRSVLIGLVRPVRHGHKTSNVRTEPFWQACDLDLLLKRIRLVHSPDGDWHAMAADPLQIAEVVGRAERSLGPRSGI
jgi:hypothetical protein